MQPVTGWTLTRTPRAFASATATSWESDPRRTIRRKFSAASTIAAVTGCVYAAEHLVMMTLAVLKRLGRSLHAAAQAGGATVNGSPLAGARRTDEDTFAYNWPGYADLRGLTGKTVAILGMGEIGVELARRLKGFAPGAVLYHKRTPYPADVERELGVASADREECLARADALVCLFPYGPETDLSLGAAAFGRMKQGAALVHGGSGSVLDEGALLSALRSGRLSGAALDTYEWEPLAPEHPLAAYARDPASNLLLTPHVAGAAEPGSYAGDFDEVVRFLGGEPLRWEV